MIYLIGYLLLYCLSFYLIQRDWRQSLDANAVDIAMFGFVSIFLLGIWVFTFGLIGAGITKVTGGKKVVWKRYKK